MQKKIKRDNLNIKIYKCQLRKIEAAERYRANERNIDYFFYEGWRRAYIKNLYKSLDF